MPTFAVFVTIVKLAFVVTIQVFFVLKFSEAIVFEFILQPFVSLAGL